MISTIESTLNSSNTSLVQTNSNKLQDKIKREQAIASKNNFSQLETLYKKDIVELKKAYEENLHNKTNRKYHSYVLIFSSICFLSGIYDDLWSGLGLFILSELWGSGFIYFHFQQKANECLHQYLWAEEILTKFLDPEWKQSEITKMDALIEKGEYDKVIDYIQELQLIDNRELENIKTLVTFGHPKN